MITKIQRRTIFAVSFLFTSQYAFLSYVNSLFLTDSRNISIDSIGFIYSISSIITIFLLFYAPRLFSYFGNKKFSISLLAISSLSLLSLIVFHGLIPTWISFIIYLAITAVISLTFDLTLEHYTKNSNTGNTRGTYLTILNLTWVIMPMIGAFLISHSVSFEIIYIIALIFTLISLAIVTYKLKKYHYKLIQTDKFFNIIQKFWHITELRHVFKLSFLLAFFYAIMTIYLPIFLIQHIGLTLLEFSYILPIMLLPFVLTEKKIGQLADKKYGEQEFIVAGIMILIITSVVMAFTTASTWWIWAIILFTSRVGASLVEISTESYFFKQIDDKSALSVAIFREANPIAYLFAPIIASIALTTLNISLNYLWLILAIVLVSGLLITRKFKDSK